MTGSKTGGRFRKILVRYGRSQESEKAFQVGLSIANTLDSRLESLFVIQPGEPATNGAPHDGLEYARKHHGLALRKIVQAANGRGTDVETSIVVGHRGTPRFKDLEMGSCINPRTRSLAMIDVGELLHRKYRFQYSKDRA